MATHSSILAWRMPWIEEPGGLKSIGHKELDMIEVMMLACMRVGTMIFFQEQVIYNPPASGSAVNRQLSAVSPSWSCLH